MNEPNRQRGAVASRGDQLMTDQKSQVEQSLVSVPLSGDNVLRVPAEIAPECAALWRPIPATIRTFEAQGTKYETTTRILVGQHECLLVASGAISDYGMKIVSKDERTRAILGAMHHAGLSDRSKSTRSNMRKRLNAEGRAIVGAALMFGMLLAVPDGETGTDGEDDEGGGSEAPVQTAVEYLAQCQAQYVAALARVVRDAGTDAGALASALATIRQSGDQVATSIDNLDTGVTAMLSNASSRQSKRAQDAALERKMRALADEAEQVGYVLASTITPAAPPLNVT